MRIHIRYLPHPRSPRPWQIITQDGKALARTATLAEACNRAIRHVRLFLLDGLMQTVTDVPDEYHGIPARLISGTKPGKKAKTIYQAAETRGMKVTFHYEHADEPEDDIILVTLRK